jgi:type I restriction-modification system DNA methylase subunit
VLDPAAGEGGFLVAAHRAATADRALSRSNVDLRGWELDPTALRVARQRMLVHGIEAILTQRDSLGEPSHDRFHADAVICDPPYSLRVRPEQWAAADDRWLYGIPAPHADLGWVQLALHHLRDDGRAAVLTGMGALWRPGHEARIRLGLVQAGAVEAVIGLPSGTALHTDIRLALWLLRRPRVHHSAPEQRILFVDAARDEQFRAVARPVRYMNTLSVDAGRAVSARIAGVVEAWREDPAAPMSSGFASAIAIPELALGDVNLSPDRLVHFPASPGELHTAVNDAIAKHAAVQSQLATLPSLKAPPLEPARAGRSAKVWKLLAAGRVELVSGTRVETNETDRGIAVLGPWSFNNEPVRYIESDDSPPRVQPGDVVVMPAGGWFSAFVNDEADLALVAPLQAIRIREPALDDLECLHPVVLATAVVADRGARTGTAGRRSIKNVEVPLLGRNHAEELANFLTVMKHEQDLSEEAATLRSRLTELVLAALTGS